MTRASTLFVEQTDCMMPSSYNLVLIGMYKPVEHANLTEAFQ